MTKSSLYQAQPPLEFIPPTLNPTFLRIAQVGIPLWMRLMTSIVQVEAENVEILTDLYRQFEAGKIRFMLAFRHPKVEDPVCLGYMLSQIVPKVAKQEAKSGLPKLNKPVHCHFIYDRGVPLWAGSHIGWIAQNLGGTPIQRGKADWTGLRSARDLFANGEFPMAAAPEGATNGLTEIVNPLEPGIAQFGFWCAEDLHKAGRNQEVLIVPVGIKYYYLDAPWHKIADLLTELETACGMAISSTNQPPSLESLYPRLVTFADHLLGIMENFYTKFYHRDLPKSQETSDKNLELATRLQTLLDVILQVAEEYFDLQPKGNLNDRCRRVEQAGWNYIFRDDFRDIKSLSPLEKGLGDRIAEEANLRMWHMRLVENFVAVTGTYIREKPSFERFAEMTLIFWEMVTCILGQETGLKTPHLGKQQAKITIGQPLSVSQRYPAYKANRLSARQAVADFTQDLQVSLEKLI